MTVIETGGQLPSPPDFAPRCAREATSGTPKRSLSDVAHCTTRQPTRRTAASHRYMQVQLAAKSDSFRPPFMYHVYIITSQSNTQRYYIGFSSRPNERLQEHNDGKNPSLPPLHPGP